MTHEEFLQAKALEQDIDMLTEAIDLFPPDGEVMGLPEVSALALALAPVVAKGTGDAEIASSIQDAAMAFASALKTSFEATITGKTSERESI